MDNIVSQNAITHHNPCPTCKTQNIIFFLWDPVVGHHYKCHKCKSVYLANSEPITSICDMHYILLQQKQLNNLLQVELAICKQNIQSMKQELDEMRKHLTAVYFAPNMPGFYETFHHYNNSKMDE